MLKLIGQETMDVSASSQVVRGLVGLELVLVLDNTGSMSGNKITALKSAANDLVDILETAVKESGAVEDDSLLIGLVPFTATVNVGYSDGFKGSWIDGWKANDSVNDPTQIKVSTPKAQYHGANFVRVTKNGAVRPDLPVNHLEIFNSVDEVDWGGCVEARPYPLNVQDTAPSTGDDHKFVPYLVPDEPDCHDNACSSSSAVDHISYYSNVFNNRRIVYDDEYTRISGYRRDYYEDYLGRIFQAEPSSALRTDLSADVTQWLNDLGVDDDSDEYRLRRVYPGRRDGPNKEYDGKYEAANSSNRWRMNRDCPELPILDLTDVLTQKSTVTDHIADMVASGTTNIPLGVIWGLRVLSPEEPFTKGAEYDDPERRKAMVILTDGANYVSDDNTWLDTEYTAYGYGDERRLGDTINTKSEIQDKMDDFVLEACDEAKDKGVSVYTIAFSVSSTSVINMMRDCATEPGFFFNSPSTSDLETTFRVIAEDLASLHISR